jgi:DMSO reductase family type II enzyme heme b subunit
MTRLMAGIDGAGMPSYVGAVTPQDAWQLAYYVASVQEPARWNLIAHAARIAGPLPETLDDPRWVTAERTDVPLRNVVQSDGEWVDPPTVVSVAVQAVYNGEAVAWRLSWDDPSQDPHGSPDALAVVLKPEAARGDTVTLQAWPYVGAPALDVCYWSAEENAAREAVTTDYAAAMSREAAPSSLTAAANYDDGRWQLVLQRPARPTHPEGAAAMIPDEFVSMAFVAWDGGNPGARAVSPWIDLVLSDGHEHAHH